MNPNTFNLPLSEELLSFYRQRIIKAEGELQNSIDRIEDVKVSHNQYHEVVRDLNQKEVELEEVKKGFSDAQTAIFEERKHLLRVISENDELKIREVQDRKKIQYLLALGVKVENETTYFRPKVSKNAIQPSSKKQQHGDSGSSTTTSPIFPDTKENVSPTLGTFFRDTEEAQIEINALKLRVTALQTQLTEQSKTYEGLIKQLKNEKAVRTNDLERQNEKLRAQVNTLLEENNKLRQISRENIKELLQTKKDFKNRERILVEEKTGFYEEKKQLIKKITQLEQEFREVEKAVETRFLRNQEAQMQDLKEKLNKSNEENKKLKASIDANESLFKKSNSTLEKRMENLSNSYMNLKKRRHFEIEGFTNDILSLRKQLKQLEKALLKFAPLQDKEFALLAMASKTAANVEHISANLFQLRNLAAHQLKDLQTTRF